MKPIYFFTGVALLVLLLSLACNNKQADAVPIPTDTAAIAAGKTIFEQQCSGCHNFKQDGIGPNLAGVTGRDSVAWLRQFIANPKAALDGGDARAHGLLKKFKTVMPSFASFTNENIANVIAYLHTQKKAAEKQKKAHPFALTNPIPDTIASSGIVANLQLLTQVPHSANETPFTRIAKLDYLPNNGALFILDQRGILYTLNDNKPVPYLNMGNKKPHFINQPGLATGFGSFAFHPEFKRNGLFYTTHTEAPGSGNVDFGYADSIKVTVQWVLTEWKASDPNAAVFEGASRELLRINMVAGIHGVQEIAFNPYAKKGTEDYGQLYIGVGDGGAVENGYPFLAHRINQVWGAVLRIDPLGHNSANGKYGIFKNPFLKKANALPEIYAYGFRNPSRIAWSKRGQMLVTNIGQANIESVYVVSKGQDCGWPLREGPFALHPDDINFVYTLPANDTAFHITYPVVQYDHDEGKAISGGFEYSGAAIPELNGKYLFGDVPTGRLFYADLGAIKAGGHAMVKEWKVALDGKPATFKNLCGADRVDLHFGQDKKGEIYLLTKPDGKVYKLVGTATGKHF